MPGNQDNALTANIIEILNDPMNSPCRLHSTATEGVQWDSLD